MKYQYKYEENISIVSDNYKTAAYIIILATPRSVPVQQIYKMTIGQSTQIINNSKYYTSTENTVADI